MIFSGSIVCVESSFSRSDASGRRDAVLEPGGMPEAAIFEMEISDPERSRRDVVAPRLRDAGKHPVAWRRNAVDVQCNGRFTR